MSEEVTRDQFVSGVYYYLCQLHATKNHGKLASYYTQRVASVRQVMWDRIRTWYPDTYEDMVLSDKITTHSLIENYLRLDIPLEKKRDMPVFIYEDCDWEPDV